MVEYKGATIEPSAYGGFEWQHPGHVDAEWTGDGWVSFGCGLAQTIQDCKDEIDQMLEELNEESL